MDYTYTQKHAIQTARLIYTGIPFWEDRFFTPTYHKAIEDYQNIRDLLRENNLPISVLNPNQPKPSDKEIETELIRRTTNKLSATFIYAASEILAEYPFTDKSRRSAYSSPGTEFAARYREFLAAVAATDFGPALYDVTGEKNRKRSVEKALCHAIARSFNLPGEPADYSNPGSICAAIDKMAAEKDGQFATSIVIETAKVAAKGARRPPAERCYAH